MKHKWTLLTLSRQASCGLEHTACLKSMFNDMKLSKIMQEEYLPLASNSIEFSALVLTKGIWPLKEDATASLILPSLFQSCKESFESFFARKYSSKTLRWINQYGKGEVRMTYTQKNHFLICSVHQIAVLDQFNRTKIISKVGDRLPASSLSLPF